MGQSGKPLLKLILTNSTNGSDDGKHPRTTGIEALLSTTPLAGKLNFSLRT
jgi:hypothetical protein